MPAATLAAGLRSVRRASGKERVGAALEAQARVVVVGEALDRRRAELGGDALEPLLALFFRRSAAAASM
jgi:hypothetical protein